MHNERNMIKWLPFNSVVSSKEMINEILKEKIKIKMPNLSEEQKNYIENSIIDAFYQNETIYVEYFYNGKIYNFKSKIKKIDLIYHKIYFNNKILSFNQIVKVL